MSTEELTDAPICGHTARDTNTDTLMDCPSPMPFFIHFGEGKPGYPIVALSTHQQGLPNNSLKPLPSSLSRAAVGSDKAACDSSSHLVRRTARPVGSLSYLTTAGS